MTQKQATTHEQSADDLRTILLRDHARLEFLFDEVLAAFKVPDAPAERASAWHAFDLALSAHLALEEELMLPRFALTNAAESAALIEEHQQIRKHLLELSVGVDLHMTDEAVVAAFVMRLRAHARREDGLMYRWAQEGMREAQVVMAIRERLS